MWHGSVLLYRYEPRILEFLEEGRSLNFSKLGAKNLVVKGGGEGLSESVKKKIRDENHFYR